VWSRERIGAWIESDPIQRFTMLNLFIGIIVDTMQTMHDDQIAAGRQLIEQTLDRDTAQIGAEVRALREEIRALRQEFSRRP
jgi:voltage-gated sodium channel